MLNWFIVVCSLCTCRTSDRLEIVPLSAVLMFSPGKAFHDVSISEYLLAKGKVNLPTVA